MCFLKSTDVRCGFKTQTVEFLLVKKQNFILIQQGEFVEYLSDIKKCVDKKIRKIKQR